MIKNYTVINIDTIINYSKNEQNDGSFETLTNKIIEADIILDSLPDKYDEEKMKSELKAIMKTKNIHSAYFFRDIPSSIAFKMSSMTADSILKSRNGYLGHLETK